MLAASVLREAECMHKLHKEVQVQQRYDAVGGPAHLYKTRLTAAIRANDPGLSWADFGECPGSDCTDHHAGCRIAICCGRHTHGAELPAACCAGWKVHHSGRVGASYEAQARQHYDAARAMAIEWDDSGSALLSHAGGPELALGSRRTSAAAITLQLVPSKWKIVRQLHDAGLAGFDVNSELIALSGKLASLLTAELFTTCLAHVMAIARLSRNVKAGHLTLRGHIDSFRVCHCNKLGTLICCLSRSKQCGSPTPSQLPPL